jgi:predicted aspartyl protease
MRGVHPPRTKSGRGTEGRELTGTHAAGGRPLSLLLLTAVTILAAWTLLAASLSLAPATEREGSGPAVTEPAPTPPAAGEEPAEESAPEDPLAQVRGLLEEDRFEEALAEARRLAEADGGSAGVRALLGDALYRRGDFEEAESAYRASIAADPGFAEGQFGVGRILRTLGRYGEAAEFFHRAAALDPENAKYVRILANHLARREDVISMLTRYLEMPPAEEERIRGNVSAWIELLKFLGDEPLREIVEAEPTDLPLNVLRGQAYFKADVNKRKGQRFAFDTGATGITVSPRLAKRAKLKTIKPFIITGMGGKGTVQGDLVLIRHLTVGGVKLRNVAATVAEPAGMEEGLIGPSLFSAFEIRVDLKGGTLSLRRHPPGAPAAEGGATSPEEASSETGGSRRTPSPGTSAGPGQGRLVRFRNVGGQIVIPADLNGMMLNAMVDTGAQSSSASFSAVPRVPDLEVLSEAASRGRSFGLAGSMRRKTIRTGTLRFGGEEFSANGMPCVDLSRFSRALGSEIYILIGFPELERFVFTIDYRTNSLSLTPRTR